MAAIDQLQINATSRLFKWDVKLPAPPPYPPLECSSHSGLFLVRLTTLPQCCPNDHKKFYPFRDVAIVTCSRFDLEFFVSLELTELFLHVTLDELIFEGSDKDILVSLVSQIARDIHCKFCFIPELLSDEGSKPVIFIDLEVGMDIEASPLDYAADSASDDEFEINKLIFAVDLKSEQIEEFLKRHPEIQVQEPRGFVEVKTSLKIKPFDEDNNSNSDDDDDDDSGVKLCTICSERLSKGTMVVETACSHTFHRKCAFQWMSKNDSCPICRASCAALA